MANLLRAVSQKHEEGLVTSPKPKKQRYAVPLMNIAHSVSGRFSAVKVGDMLEQRRTDLLLSKELVLALLEGRHRRSCIQKLADSCEPGAERASQPIRMNRIKAPGIQPLTNHEILKLDRSVNIMGGLML